MSRHLLFEIGVEEVPSAPLYDAITQLEVRAERMLADARLGYESIAVYGAPRRLALAVRGLADRQEDVTLRHKGPAAKAAFDTEGVPTKAAAGFARGKGVAVEDLVVEAIGGGEYVVAVVEEIGRAAAEVLPALLANLAAAIEWPKSQRWGSGTARFIRPVRWLVGLLGDEVLPVSFAGLTAGRTTIGHRFLGGAVELADAADYVEALRGAHVLVDQAERAAVLREAVDAAARAAGGTAVVPEKTFAEVVNLVEWPTVAAGHFDTAFLSVPREVLEEAMESHQRYFPVEGPDGSLCPSFIVAHNGDPARTDAIAAGHERVIRARLADAAFFYHEDLKQPLEASVGRLASIVFQEKLGSLGAKTDRIERLAGVFAHSTSARPDDAAYAARAAHLAKADLVSHAVVEFTSLQGVMGGYYALASGEAPEVARAIVEHYRPRFAGDELPSTAPGMLVSVADKLDTIAGIIAIGQGPTGSSDPYALRRFAIGVLSMIIDGGLSLTLQNAVAEALAGYRDALPDLDVEATSVAVKAFIVGRLEGMLRERGHAYDTVAAVLAVAADDPADALARCEALTRIRATEVAIADLSVAFTRARNLSRPELGTQAAAALMGEVEASLALALDRAERDATDALAVRDYDRLLGVLAELRGPIDAFFDGVLVMDSDESLRTMRLQLLNRFVAVFETFADFGVLEG